MILSNGDHLFAQDYGLTAVSIYRHAHASGLFAKRDRNIRAGLARIIERVATLKSRHRLWSLQFRPMRRSTQPDSG